MSRIDPYSFLCPGNTVQLLGYTFIVNSRTSDTVTVSKRTCCNKHSDRDILTLDYAAALEAYYREHPEKRALCRIKVL